MARGCRIQSARPKPEQPTAAERGYGNDWRIARRNAIERWVMQNGWVCPGYGAVPRHGVNAGELQGDHWVPVAMGGTIADGVDVLCGPCNVARGRDTLEELRRRDPHRHSPASGATDDEPDGLGFA